MSNPAFNDKVWNRIGQIEDVNKMDLNRTIHKAGFLILLTLIGGGVGAMLNSLGIVMVALIVNLILSFVIIFKPHTATYLSQPYAFIEGLALGSISIVYSSMYAGIVTNTLFLTMACFAVMLALYYFKVIQVTERVRSVIVAATLSIAVVYLINIVMRFFGTEIPMIHQATPMGIAFSVVAVGIAAFNLLLDFDLIEQSYKKGAPKFMEWYCGFALLLTLVWLYLEMLRLLSKLNKK